MAGPKTIYVRDGDEPMWQQAEDAAKVNGESLAGYVARAIKESLERDGQTVAAGEIIIEIRPTADDSWRKQRFHGRWLREPHTLSASDRMEFGVAETRGGRFLGYIHDTDEGVTRTAVADSLSELADLIVPEALSDAAETLGEEYIEDLDI